MKPIRLINAIMPKHLMSHRFPFLFALLALGLATLNATAAVGTYSNPVMEKGADPAILFHDGTYYAYTTNSEGRVMTSKNLVDWEVGPVVMPEGLLKAWAPEVYFHPEDGKYYLYYTDRYKIGVAVADRPDAQFTDLGYLIISAIDGHLFRDDDGALYLYFTYTPTFTMYCVPMATPTEPAGPATKCFEISQEWEQNEFSINEGPWIMKQNGTYYLFYSGSDGQSRFYSVGYASAPTPMGPFTKYADNPVIRHTENIWGPGHGSMLRVPDGSWWHLYHQKTGTEKGWKRMLCLDPMNYDEASGVFTSIPTKGTEQPAPVTDPNLVWSPDISPRGAYFYAKETVSLSSVTPDVAIYYTLDGSEPDQDSTKYTEPFTIDQSLTVKARAYREGMTTSTVAEMKFFRTNWTMPTIEKTEYPSGNPPFRVNPYPNLAKPSKR